MRECKLGAPRLASAGLASTIRCRSGQTSTAPAYELAGDMDEPRTPEKVCEEVSADLRDMGAWLSTGRLSEAQFRVSLLALEAEKVKRFGFALTGRRTPEGRTHFELRFVEDDRL